MTRGKHSAGILLYRTRGDRLEVMLVHPGGPFWAGKDDGAWSIPKGLFEDKEEPLEAAKREFREETGFDVDGDLMALGEMRQPSGKIIHAWAVQGDVDVESVRSNTFTLEWPKNSGRFREFPEVDEARWFTLDCARRKILKGQAEFLERLEHCLGAGSGRMM